MGLTWSDEREKGDYRWVPEAQGLYQLIRAGIIVYIGESSNVVARLQEHEIKTPGWGTYRYATRPPGTSKDERRLIEARLIAFHWPAWNREQPR